MLTKMRLLAGPAVVEAAMRLHLAAHAYVALTDLEPPQPSPEEVDETHARMWEARRSFLTVAKVEIGLRPEVSSVTHAPF
jgi:hypothetical protein